MEIANILSRSERFVNKWWQKEEQAVPKPWGVHGFLGGEMGFEAVQSGATIGEDTATDAATWWRDVEIRRGFARDPAIYTEIMENAAWEGLPSNTKDFRTGAAVMKYMKDGSVCKQSYQKARYSPGLSPATDKALQKLFAEYGIEGRTVGVLLNRYDDGEAMLGSHRHDCWTALFSFGSERILTIDHTPLLCQDGDLVIFGTQRHGVPKMPDISTGRVTVVVFFYPNESQKQSMWQTITDDGNSMPSRTLVAIQHDTMLGSSAQDWALWGFGGRGFQALEQLKRVGLVQTESDSLLAKETLIKHKLDIEYVAAVLARDHAKMGEALKKHARLVEASVPRGRWGRRAEAGGSDRTASEQLTLMSVEDVQFCKRVLKRVAEGIEVSQCCDLELPTGHKPQFKAEDWDGVSGDLVAHFLRGGNVRLEDLDSMIKLDEMTPADLVSVGAGSLSERAFFDMLSSQGVHTVYDLRASESQRDMHAHSHTSPHFSSKSLRIACKARSILYKSMPIGRESAYGVLCHLKSAEGQHILLELVWQAQRARTAFLGTELDWSQDARCAIAEELCKAGHTVDHLLPDGKLHRHETGYVLPDWFFREEEKLRKIEKMRHAGDLQRKNKSAVDRSTESVALKLMKKPEEIDTMGVLREATNQQELKFAQRQLAAMHRYSEKYELPTKQLSGAPQFIAKEAREQAVWVEKLVKEKDSKPNGGASKEDHDGREDNDFQVQCRLCDHFYYWNELAMGDGCCRTCSKAAKVLEESVLDSLALAEDVVVECSGCGILAPWTLLAPGDGKCSHCCGSVAETSCVELSGDSCEPAAGIPANSHLVPESGASSSSSRWQRHVTRGSESQEI